MKRKPAHRNKPLKFRYRRWIEYLIINIFVFCGIGLLSLFVLNFSLFDPFTNAFKDFTLTDLYYSKIINRDSVYNGPIMLVNVEKRSRRELSFLLEHINNGKPKVIGIDVAFSDKKDSATDENLKRVLDSIPNAVIPYGASFDSLTDEMKNNEFFKTQNKSYVNMIGDNPEFSTVRSYFPYYNDLPHFTTALIQQYDSSLLKELGKKSNIKMDIRYFGNVQNFKYKTFDEAISMDPAEVKGKIILLGYIGQSTAVTRTSIDEDRLYTPLNPRLSGRSHPDMYGVVIHANILRMALDRDYVIDVPTWVNWLLAFLLSWMLIPLFTKWFIHNPMWAHFNTKLVQLGLSTLFVFFTVWLYPKFNIKLDSGAVLISVLLLADLILFYDALVKYLKTRLKWNFHSIFFEGAHGH